MSIVRSILVGLLVLVSGYSSAMDIRTLEYTEGGGKFLVMSGDISEGDFDKFSKIARRTAGLENVYLNSAGGLGLEAHKIGRLIREMGLNTVVINEDDCQSACTDIFLGGVQRFWQEGVDDLRLGFHAASSLAFEGESSSAILEYGQYYAALDTDYMAEMVALSDIRSAIAFYLSVHSRADSSEMMWPSLETMLESGIVTKHF